MKDLTGSSIAKHIVQMALPIAAGMLFQTLYILIDLYFVSGLGDAAIAGVGAAGNIMFVVLALTQVLGVGMVALISHAVGRKDRAEAERVFNQGLSLSGSAMLVSLLVGYALGPLYVRGLAADGPTAAAGTAYLRWFLPSLALQFALVAMGSALRGTGIVKPAMIVQVFTVLLNAILAPVLIAGWGSGHPLGVAGAGLASSVSVAAGVVLLAVYFHKLESYVGFHASAWRPNFGIWARLLKIGLPAGGEFALMFVYLMLIYALIRPFGPAAQAGFGIGTRVMQSLFLPAMAVSFATAPIVGQNFAAGKFVRVRETFALAALIGSCIMVVLTLFCQWGAGWAIHGFTEDPAVLAVGTQFLTVISWNFLAVGFVFTCSAVFQGLGHTLPSVISSATRIISFAIPALWLSRSPHFQLLHLWFLSVASATLQAVVSLWFVRTEFRHRVPVSREALS